MILNLWLAFDDLANSEAKTPDADGNLHPAVKGLGELTTPDLFRVWDAGGPRSYILWSVYAEVDNADEALIIRNSYLAMFPGKLRTVGGWWFDSGEQVLLDDGSIAFPLIVSLLEFMPDIVEYDTDGNETARTRPLVASDVNMGLGQAPRQFD